VRRVIQFSSDEDGMNHLRLIWKLSRQNGTEN